MTSTRVWLCATVLATALLCASVVCAASSIDDVDELDSLEFEGAASIDSDRENELMRREHTMHMPTMKSRPWTAPAAPTMFPPMPMMGPHSLMLRPMSTHNLSTVLMRAFQTKNAMLLLMMTDSNTAIFYNSDLPAGGIYKGRRGLLEMGEACMKSVRVNKSSFKIVNVDEDRSTATVIRTITGVARRTNVTFTARTMFVIKFALQRVQCIDITDLDYDVMVAALSSRAEKALARLGEEWFTHGPLGEPTQALVADNVSVVFGAVWPKTLFTMKGKQNIADMIRSNKKTDACKLLECMKNHTDESVVLHADDTRVATINFAGNVLKDRAYIDRRSEGTILHGVTRIDGHKHGMIVYFALHEFDNDGKLTRAFIQLARPLTLLDRVHLRDAHNINIKVEHTHDK